MDYIMAGKKAFPMAEEISQQEKAMIAAMRQQLKRDSQASSEVEGALGGNATPLAEAEPMLFDLQPEGAESSGVEQPSHAVPPRQPQEGDARQSKRYLVNWRVAVVNEDGESRQTFYGRVHDISVGGVSIFTDDNLDFSQEVVVLLSIPPLVPGGGVKIVEVRCRHVYTVLAASVQKFRAGFNFRRFKGNGRRILEEHLGQIFSLE